MSKVVRLLLELVDSGGDRVERERSSGDMTKHPHISAGVMLLVGDALVTEKQFREYFSEVVRELQRMSYLKKGTMKSTAKGIKLSNELMMADRFHDLMDDYEKLLEKFRKGKEEPYRGRVPLR